MSRGYYSSHFRYPPRSRRNPADISRINAQLSAINYRAPRNRNFEAHRADRSLFHKRAMISAISWEGRNGECARILSPMVEYDDIRDDVRDIKLFHSNVIRRVRGLSSASDRRCSRRETAPSRSGASAESE